VGRDAQIGSDTHCPKDHHLHVHTVASLGANTHTYPDMKKFDFKHKS